MAGILDTNLVILSDKWENALPEVASLVQLAAHTTWASLGRGPAAEVNLVLSDDEAVQKLNADYRGRDQPTNVLSFPMREKMEPDASVHLGDIVLSYGTVAFEASRDRKKVEAHLSHLVIHGLLHLLGHCHSNELEAEKMERIEISIMSALGYPNPFQIMANAAE
ncbi:MAG: rRNA maturation RNase YbeY [Pseudomonadota bacterium]|nr:rRNA maturation RNase YbeY [Pseudomonadota bacterium]